MKAYLYLERWDSSVGILYSKHPGYKDIDVNSPVLTVNVKDGMAADEMLKVVTDEYSNIMGRPIQIQQGDDPDS